MKKNILLFMTDEHMLKGVSSYGKTPCRTPNIDKLAEKGVLFSSTYTSCPLCSPARASVLTGKHIHAHGVTGNTLEMGCNNSFLADNKYNLNRMLEEQGYTCGYNGKWHISEATVPTKIGFQGWDYGGHGSGGHYYGDYRSYVKDLGFEWKIKPHQEDGEKITGFGITDFPAEATVSYYLANNTMKLIDEMAKGKNPFFMWHNDWGPHGEHWVPQEYYDMYKDIEIPEWGNYKWETDNPYHPALLTKMVPNGEQYTWEDYAEIIRHYYAFCSLIDDQVGRIVEHLEETGLMDKTVIIFSADHGETLGCHGGLTDKGWSHFEEIQRIPLIVCDPDGQKGIKEERLASLLDLYPTICDYAGADFKATDCHGRSLKPLVYGKETEWRDCVFVEFFALGGVATNMVTCRYQNIKYGWTCSNKDELYDLENDPYELHNLLDNKEYSEILLNIRKRMYTFMVESKYPAAYVFLRNILKWNIDRQYLFSDDPYKSGDNLLHIKW